MTITLFSNSSIIFRENVKGLGSFCFSFANFSTSSYSKRNKNQSPTLTLNKKHDKTSGVNNFRSAYKNLFVNLKSLNRITVLLLVVPVTSFSLLGFWQWKRLQWKLNLIQQIKDRQNEPSLEFLDQDLNLIEELEYRKVHLRGMYIYDKQFLIRNRPRFDKDYKEYGSGIFANPSMSSHGAYVITPLKLMNSSVIVMVNRGWIPPEKFEFEIINKQQPNIFIELDAIVRKSEKRPLFVSKNDPIHGNWFYKDLKEMGLACGSSPILLDAVYECSEPGGPIGGQTNITLRNEHWNYMVFWYSLAFISSLLWLQKYLI